MHSYDSYGWLSAEEIPGRTTDVEPPEHDDKTVGQPFPNFTGIEWVLATYSEPPAYVPVVIKPTMTRLQYMNRFTDAELIGIYTAAKSVVQIEIWLEKFKLAEFVDPQDSSVMTGLLAMENAGLIAAGRAAQILA